MFPLRYVLSCISKFYLDGILEGCKDNQIPTESVMEAVKRTRQEVKKEKNRYAR